MAGSALFCTKCGTRMGDAAAFCTKCGAPRAALPARGSAAAIAAQPATPMPVSKPADPVKDAGVHTFAAAGTAASAAGAAFSMAAGASGVAALPWQTIVGAEQPDIRAFLSQAALPSAQRAVRASLRPLGLPMAATAVLDLIVALVIGGPAALGVAVPRFLLAGLTALLSVVTGNKGGALRGITGAVSIITALVQAVTLLYGLGVAIAAGAPLLQLASMAVTAASVLTMAIKTTVTALRRR